MRYCCDKMQFFFKKGKKEEEFDSDDIMYYAPQFDEYGIMIHDAENHISK